MEVISRSFFVLSALLWAFTAERHFSKFTVVVYKEEHHKTKNKDVVFVNSDYTDFHEHIVIAQNSIHP